MSFRVRLHPKVYQDLNDIQEDAAYKEVKDFLRALETNPYLGGALENLCQSGSISNTKGLNDGISDRHRGNITTDS